MSTSSRGLGIVVDRGGLVLRDTREMPWVDLPGIPGAKQKVLVRDADGEPSVQFTWLPPGLRSDRPERHFHKTVLERGYVLFGELPLREFASIDDEQGRPVLFKEGYYMDRRPGSVHGLDFDNPSPVGFLILEWRTGPGTYLGEPRAAEETTVLDASVGTNDTPLCPPGSPHWVVVDSGNLCLLDTRAMPWTELPGMKMAKMKVLSLAAAGHTEVVILNLAPRPTGGAPMRHFHRTVREAGLVLDGDLPMREYLSMEDDIGERVCFQKGYFMDRAPGSIHGVDTSRSSGIGFTFLEWRAGPGTYLLEPEAATETPDFPARQLKD